MLTCSAQTGLLLIVLNSTGSSKAEVTAIISALHLPVLANKLR